MIPRERIAFWLWIGTIVAAATGLSALTFFGPQIGIITGELAQVVGAWGLFVATIWIAARLILFFAVPPRVRYIRLVTAFVMAWTASLT